MNSVGKKIKELRTGNKMTLKELSEKTGFSIGFLSQLERGLTTIAIDSLDTIAKELHVDISYFLSPPKEQKQIVLRSYEQEVYQIVNNHIFYNLTNHISERELLPRLIHILPMEKLESIKTYSHEGEEFVYVLEGILTLVLNDEEYSLYPGDSAHYSSMKVHNWANYTNKVVKFIAVNIPNTLKE
ncbi:helix-turn-helix domain-containing protein [Anaerosalibacter massiliensis]|uniref:XRE family transcriptional regulator n=1 Tax=Anaerosalibacter massiliensis TaxID=1347392 RepID=A0A9X2MI35_9FIRM|nr:XRE family transcriptional regulator [Anaerosalibacter massiliensis]MCR2043928.1 XRE family transcriptional regulator [Anaerosalibacter massiliensis]